MIKKYKKKFKISDLINGNFYLASEVPKTYLLINYIFRSPEYILISYLVFCLLFLVKKKFFIQKFIHFNYKISLIFCILIFPNIEAGNTFYKSTTFFGNSTHVGLILGATNPIVLTSRSDSYKSKLYSIALAVVSTDIL